jgi:hypothetical protein
MSSAPLAQRSSRHAVPHAGPPQHKPKGDPCADCGLPASKHYYRPEHLPDGEICSVCGLPESRHRIRCRPQHRPEGDPCTRCGIPAEGHKTVIPRPYQYRPYQPTEPFYVGVDGEGQGRIDHRYVLLAASSEPQFGKRWYVENRRGLSTVECLDFLLSLPDGGNNRYRLFAYAFQYDLTKILTDLDNRSLYFLFHPNLRQRNDSSNPFGPPYAVHWNGFRLNMQGSKFVVQKGARRKVVWDVFKFFQGRFVAACRDWKVGSDELLDRMQIMKELRSDFDKLDMGQVREYCFEECECMATLARKLTEAHAAADIRLRSYYGAGSSAGAMLAKMGIRPQIPESKSFPPAFNEAVAASFFGGRFENSVIGPIPGPIYSYDISSAYPYQICFLPCLVHGKWKHTRQRKHLERRRQALVRYSLGPCPRKTGWGPFPFRDETGAISFPIESGGGWVWLSEYLAGERLFPHVEFQEAWVYEEECDCQPFKDIPRYYLERCRIGKEGPGIVLKLGCNSCYGKLAQSVGKAPFNCWPWASMITSGCRGQLLELYGLCPEPEQAIMMATDGLCTTVKLQPPLPLDTGTGEALVNGKRKPLGGWEDNHDKPILEGMFLARPGIYFPLDIGKVSEEERKKMLKTIRGRGVGRSVIVENWKEIREAWPPRRIADTVRLSNVSRFCGALSSIYVVTKKNGKRQFLRSNGSGKEPAYGQWITRPVDMSFDPLPKRQRVLGDKKSLELRRFPRKQTSMPYKRAISAEAAILRMVAQEASEQPDADLLDYELEDTRVSD